MRYIKRCYCLDKFSIYPTTNILFSPEGRKRKKMKKTKKIEFRVSLTEYLIIKNKAKKTGGSMSEYLRGIALDYDLTYKLTDNEIEVYKQLNKFSDNFRRISNLFKLGDTTGVKETSIETAKLIRDHLNKLK